MHSQVKVAELFLNTFDGSAAEDFRSYLSGHPQVTKWMIAADFSLHDPERPMDCMAFTFIPYDAEFDELKADVHAALPKDLKKTKALSSEAAAWLREKRRFHVPITLSKLRQVFYNDAQSDSLRVAREHIEFTISALNQSPGMYAGMLKRFKKLQQAAKANSFNVELLSDIWLLGIWFGVLTLVLARERRCEIIGWFPDRDNMTNWCDGVWQDYALENARSFCDIHQVDLHATKLVAGAPDRSIGKEAMWFDHTIRAADWFAGSIGAWDRSPNLVPSEHPKYRQMLENVVADAENIAIIHCDIAEQMQFRRILAVSRKDDDQGAT